MHKNSDSALDPVKEHNQLGNGSDMATYETEIQVVGDNLMQNKLLLSYINAQTGLKCSQMQNIDISNQTRSNLGENKMLLLDSKGRDFFHLWDTLEHKPDSSPPKNHIAVFNLKPDRDLEMEAVDKGVEGVFYESEPLEVIPKGIYAILEGDMWFSRKTLSQYLMSRIDNQDPPGDAAAALTKREKEILNKLSIGESNTEIADTFCISYNTVKTHIFNIYKKIAVGNRFQATLWAAKHL